MAFSNYICYLFAGNTSMRNTVEIIVCQGKSADLCCPQAQILKFQEVFYGRPEGCTCQCDICHNLTQTCSANASIALGKLEEKCAQGSKCSVRATENEFGNPCKGIKKILVIKFSCLDS